MKATTKNQLVVQLCRNVNISIESLYKPAHSPLSLSVKSGRGALLTIMPGSRVRFDTVEIG